MILGHSFKSGDIVAHINHPDASVYWIINKEQYVSLELYPFGKNEGREGLYLAGGASQLNWEGYVKVCTIDQLKAAVCTCAEKV